MVEYMGQQVSKVIGTGPTPVLSSNPRRRCLVVSGDPAARITINFGNDQVTLDNGITINPATAPTVLRFSDIGRLLTQDVTAIASVAGAHLNLIEGSEP
jgi:hypothetical protein